MGTDARLPLVSVMIPTYNQKDYLPTAIESALAQTYPNLEIIVSDDASPDPAVAELLERYTSHPNVRIYRNETNLGRVANYRMTLYERASGEWVVNLDGDDYFHDPTFIEKAMGLVVEHPGLVMVSCRCLEETGAVWRNHGGNASLNLTVEQMVDNLKAVEAPRTMRSNPLSKVTATFWT